eukprot:1953432-Pleurochrysis_carterae.AAC.1
MLRWIRVPPQARKTRAARTLGCDALRDATPLTCAQMDAIYRKCSRRSPNSILHLPRAVL